MNAEIMAGKTVEATRLHYQVRRWQFDLYLALHDLGKKVYEQLHTSGKKEFEGTPAVMNIVERVTDLQEKIATTEERLKHLSVVAPMKDRARSKKNHRPEARS